MLRSLSSLAALLALLAAFAPSAAAAAATGDSIEGDEGDTVVVAVGDVVVDRGETVDGIFIASGDARVHGEVDGDVVVLDGDVLVSGRIDGDLFTAAGQARLLPRAVVTGDIQYGDERPEVARGATIQGDVREESFPAIDALPWVAGLVFWIAITISAWVLGALLLLLAPRAADALEARSRERVGPLIAIGLAIFIVLPIIAFLAAITLVGLPLAIAIGLALLPLWAVAHVVSAYVLGRRILKPPRHRMLAFLVGLLILQVLVLVPILGWLIGLAAVIFGLGLIGAAIGAAREGPSQETAPAHGPGS